MLTKFFHTALVALVVLTTILGCASQAKLLESPEIIDPGWQPAPWAEVTHTSYHEGILSFYIQPEADWVGVSITSPRWRLDFPLTLDKGFFVGSVHLEDPDDFEYLLVLTNSQGKKERILDPANLDVAWKKPLWSVFHLPETPLPVIKYYPNNKERSYLVMLPAGYFQNSTKKYPVMYWHDGQNMPSGPKSPFGGWKADKTEDALAQAGAIDPIIQVGVFNSSRRMTEYTSWINPAPDGINWGYSSTAEEAAQSQQFIDWIVNTLKPRVDGDFRTLSKRENTGVGGSSAGAMLALYMGFTHSDVFGKVAGFAGGELPYRVLRERYFRGDLNLKIYLDCGTVGVDAQLLPETKKMGEFLLSKGYVQGKNLFFQVFEKDNHNEQDWARRLPGALTFLFPKRNE